MKRLILCAITLLATFSLINNSNSQSYPAKPITVVIPNAPGSATDTISRLIGQKLSERLKQPVIFDNRAGGNTQIAAEYVARAAPDGYTILMTTNTSHSANPSLYKGLRYDPIKDFTPIVRVGQVPFVLLVNPTFPAKTVGELVAYAKANPGKVSYASPVSASLVTTETMRVKSGIDIVGVQYTSSPQALTDLMGGQFEMFVADLMTSKSAIDSGKVRAIGVSTAARSKIFPELPAIAETVPGVDVISWQGFFGPAGMPKPVTDLLASNIHEIMSDPEMQDRLSKIGYEVYLSKSPEEFGAFVAEQLVQWAKLVREAGIPPQ